MSNRLNAPRNTRRPAQPEPKTLIRIRPWLEAKRRPGDGMWSLWYLGTVELERNGDHVETYRGWVQVNVARRVKELLDTAPAWLVR